MLQIFTFIFSVPNKRTRSKISLILGVGEQVLLIHKNSSMNGVLPYLLSPPFLSSMVLQKKTWPKNMMGIFGLCHNIILQLCFKITKIPFTIFRVSLIAKPEYNKKMNSFYDWKMSRPKVWSDLGLSKVTFAVHLVPHIPWWLPPLLSLIPHWDVGQRKDVWSHSSTLLRTCSDTAALLQNVIFCEF